MGSEMCIRDRYESYYYDGMVEGKEKGIEQGIEQGLAQGIEQGIEQGMEKGINKVAMKLLSANIIDKQSISKITGLSLKEVEALSMDAK